MTAFDADFIGHLAAALRESSLGNVRTVMSLLSERLAQLGEPDVAAILTILDVELGRGDRHTARRGKTRQAASPIAKIAKAARENTIIVSPIAEDTRLAVRSLHRALQPATKWRRLERRAVVHNLYAAALRAGWRIRFAQDEQIEQWAMRVHTRLDSDKRIDLELFVVDALIAIGMDAREASGTVRRTLKS